MKVRIYDAHNTTRGCIVVVQDTEHPDRAAAISFCDHMDEETAVSRVKNAFAGLRSLNEGVAA